MEDKVQLEVKELIQKSQFKQCYDKIAQLSKIYRNNQFLKVLEVYVKYKQSPQKFDIATQLETPFLETKSPITDPKTLNLLHDFFVELQMFEDALRVIEIANLKQNKIEISYELYVKSIEDSNFNFLIRATSSLSNFKLEDKRQTRSYSFWNAIATIAAFRYQKERLTDQEINILPLLCYKRLSNLRPFQNLQEIIIYCMFIEEFFSEDNEKVQEMTDIILPELDKNVDLYLKNFLVRNVKDPQMLFDSCRKLLGKIDDFKLIKSLIQSGHQLGYSRDDLFELIEKCVGDSRNYRLSQFEIDLEYNDNSMIHENTLKYYLAKFHNKPCCCIDLESYREHLDMNTVKKCFQEFNDDLIHDTNMFQLSLNDEDAVTLFRKHESNLDDKLDTDYSTLSIFVISIVEDVLSYHEGDQNDDTALHKKLLALSILQNYQNKDKNNYNTKIWLIALYMELGLSSIAITSYLELKIKNVQVDTLDYLIFGRFSTINAQKQHDYISKILPKDMMLYENNEKLSRFIQISMERSTYSKILGMFELKTKLISSLNRWSNMIEQLQLSRLCNDKRNKHLQELHTNHKEFLMISNGEICDNRDFKMFEHNKNSQNGKFDINSVVSYFNVNDKWVHLNILKEFIIEILPQNSRSEQIDSLLVEVGIHDVNDIGQVSKNAHFTSMEEWSFKLIYCLYINDVDTVTKLLNSDTAEQNECYANWSLTHNYLMRISTLKTLDAIKRFSKYKSVFKQRLQELRDHCDEMYQDYKTAIEIECKRLHDDKILQDLKFLPLGHESLLQCITSMQKVHRNL